MKATTLKTAPGAEALNIDGVMQAALIDEPNSLRLAQVAIPRLAPGEALIKVQYCGICGSDIHILKGQHATATFPRIPGHEFVGELVELCGDAGALAIGDMVVAQPFFSCGNCEPCAKGRDNICRSLRFMGAHVDGAFAQYVKVLTRKVYKLPKGTDPRLAALAEPIAVAVHDVRGSGLQVGETALVIGGGPIGLMIAMVARQAGAGRVVISEISDYRRGVAEKLGFEAANPLDNGFEAAIMDSTDGLGFDVVFEVSGSKAGVASSTRFAKNTGRVMVVGMTSEPYPVDLSAVFAKELQLRGVRIHSQYSFVGAVELLRQGALNEAFIQMVTHTYPMAQVEAAFAHAQSPGDYLKILVEM